MEANEFLIQLASAETQYKASRNELRDGEYNPHRHTMVELVMHFIEHSFANDDVAAVNEALGRIDAVGRDPSILIGLLRASFRARNLLPNWWIARTIFHQELTRQGHDANRMLRGLMHWKQDEGEPINTRQFPITTALFGAGNK